MSPEEARHAAMRSFGDPTALKEETRAILNSDVARAPAELAKHSRGSRSRRAATLTLLRQRGILLGVAVSVVLGEGIGPNVCLFTSSGWRRPDPCCYESHKKPKQLTRSRTPESCRFSTRWTATSAYSVASIVSLSPIALVTATSVDKRGVALDGQSAVKTLTLDACSLGNFGDALSLG